MFQSIFSKNLSDSFYKRDNINLKFFWKYIYLNIVL